MGKATGFIDTKREDLNNRPVKERVKDWQEVKQDHYSKEILQAQAGRCMDCSIPFCHTGSIINDALVGCPLHNLTPEFNEFVYQDIPEFAYIRLCKNNNFPEPISILPLIHRFPPSQYCHFRLLHLHQGVFET